MGTLGMLQLSSWALLFGSASIVNELIDFEYDRRPGSRMLTHVLGFRKSLAIVGVSHVYFIGVLIVSFWQQNYATSIYFGFLGLLVYFGSFINVWRATRPDQSTWIEFRNRYRVVLMFVLTVFCGEKLYLDLVSSGLVEFSFHVPEYLLTVHES